ncbi:hypothetical protein DXG01_006748 [Tephrocybe rancida]|nr:hypothetical protein DXG01_006748 [Tephrocybe rancida]
MYWALLSSELEFIYLEPLLAEQAPFLLGKALLSFVHPDDQAILKLKIAVLQSFNITVRVTRIRFALSTTYTRVNFFMNWAAAGLILCFIHIISDLDAAHKTIASNCGTPHLDRDHLQMCFSALLAAVSGLAPEGRMFQILENGVGHSLLLSWPPDQVKLTPSAKTLLATYAQVEAVFVDDGVVPTSCSYWYKARRHALPSVPGAEVESIFIPYGCIIFACHHFIPPIWHTYNPSRSSPPLPPPSHTKPGLCDPQPEVPYALTSMSSQWNHQQGQEQRTTLAVPSTHSVPSLPAVGSLRTFRPPNLPPSPSPSLHPLKLYDPTQNNSNYTLFPESLPPPPPALTNLDHFSQSAQSHSIPRAARGSPHPAADWTSDGSVDRPLRRIPDVHNSSPYARPRFVPLNIKKSLLDSPDLNPHFRKGLSVATQRISARSGLYPACYELKDVVQQGQYPVNAGGFTDIYKGVFRGRVVCLKTIRLYQNDQIHLVLKSTSKEAILWRQLLHPNVLTFFGLYRFQNRISLVTPWMENGDITVYLKKNPTAPRQRLAVDVGKGLTYLHENGIIHGDLKGPNVLVDDAGRACLADFGISSISDSRIIAWTTQSLGHARGGSTRWQAPELFAIGASDVDEEEVEAAVKNTKASDIYALGCIFFEIFTGDIPFASITRDNTVILRVSSDARPTRPPNSSLSWTEWGLTEDIWACIEDCWKGQPAERPLAAAIAQRLTPRLMEDMRRGLDTDTLFSDEFRRRMSEAFEMITVDELNKMLGTRLEPTETNGHREYHPTEISVTMLPVDL